MATTNEKLTNLGALKLLAERVKKDYATKTEVSAIGDKVDKIKVPTAVSELTNDKGYQTAADVSKAIDDFAKNVGEADVIDTLKDVIDYCAKHKGEAAEMMAAINTLETLVGDEAVAKQIADAITAALKTGGTDKYALATELAAAVSDINANKSAIEGIQTKLSTVAEGATKVAASDNGYILINGAKTKVYELPGDVIHGEIASDDEVGAMLTEVFG